MPAGFSKLRCRVFLLGGQVPKQVPHNAKKEEIEKLAFLDPGSTIKSSGMFGRISAFIPTLTFMSGPALGKEIPLINRQLILGRGTDCDITIPDPSVSRKHVQIDCRKILKRGEDPTMKIVLRDLGSRNGTFINYVQVQRAVLKPGDKIFLGRVILKFDHRDIAEQNFYEELYRLATTDSLTSLLNKATITRFLTEEVEAGVRKQRWISTVLVDIDGFKSLNDVFGHLTGDRIIQSIAELLRKSCRKRDRIGRFGGDEFLIILPETGPKGAAKLAERLRKIVETSVNAELGLSLSVTSSLGVASSCANKASPENLLENADLALYRAKALGRNRVEVWKAPRVSKENR
jgi:two-component system cell cycle response regulator